MSAPAFLLRVLCSCLLCFLLLCRPSTSLPIDAGTQRFGWDLHQQPIQCDTSRQCAQLCEKDPRCISWSYRRDHCTSLPTVAAGCWLKQALAGAQLDPCSDSGWIEERMAPRCAESEYGEWRYSQRRNTSFQPPIELSAAIVGVQLAVNCTITYTKSDTWYCSWAADDTLRCMFEDGSVNGVKVNGHPPNQSTLATSGLVTVVGSHPFHLSLHNATTVSSNLSGYIGRFPSANLYHNHTWYVANALRNSNNSRIPNCGGHCVMGPLTSFQTSEDDGRSWQDPLPLPDATHNLWHQDGGDGLSRHVKFGEVHTVDFGRAQQHNSDGYTYIIGHGSDESFEGTWELWNQGDALYMARVVLSVASVNDAEQWEFWCGDAEGWVKGAVTGGGVDCAAPLLVWPNHTGSVSMTYVPSLGRYLTVYTTPHTVNAPLNGTDLVLLESTHITGPFRLVDQLNLFGPTAYFPTLPSKFITPHLTPHLTSDSQLQLWMGFSTLSTYKYGVYGDPPYTAYSWNLMAGRLVVSTAALSEVGVGEVGSRVVLVGDVTVVAEVGCDGVWDMFLQLLWWVVFITQSVVALGVLLWCFLLPALCSSGPTNERERDHRMLGADWNYDSRYDQMHAYQLVNRSE